jgi:hypothetical protein
MLGGRPSKYSIVKTFECPRARNAAVHHKARTPRIFQYTRWTAAAKPSALTPPFKVEQADST